VGSAPVTVPVPPATATPTTPGRPAENVSLTGGVLPPQTPGAVRPGDAS
jgi:hypothetical protein